MPRAPILTRCPRHDDRQVQATAGYWSLIVRLTASLPGQDRRVCPATLGGSGAAAPALHFRVVGRCVVRRRLCVDLCSGVLVNGQGIVWWRWCRSGLLLLGIRVGRSPSLVVLTSGHVVPSLRLNPTERAACPAVAPPTFVPATRHYHRDGHQWCRTLRAARGFRPDVFIPTAISTGGPERVAGRGVVSGARGSGSLQAVTGVVDR